MIDLSIVVATYNRSASVDRLLRNLKPIAEEVEIIVIDDGSKEPFVKKEIPCCVIRMTKNVGTPTCWNLGIEAAARSNVLTLPDDVEVVADNMMAFALGLVLLMNHVGIVGLRVIDRSGKKVSSWLFKRLMWILAGQVFAETGDRFEFNRFVAGTMCFRKSLGLRFDTRFAGNGFREETDFQLRAMKQGIRICYDPHLTLLHHEERVGGQYKPNFDREHWILKNQRYFLQKHFPRSWWFKYAMFRAYRKMRALR